MHAQALTKITSWKSFPPGSCVGYFEPKTTKNKLGEMTFLEIMLVTFSSGLKATPAFVVDVVGRSQCFVLAKLDNIPKLVQASLRSSIQRC